MRSGKLSGLKRHWLANILLLAASVLVVWVAAAEFAAPKGEEKEHEGVLTRASFSPEQLDRQYWQIGSVALHRSGQFYEVTVNGRTGKPLFRFKLDAFNGRPLGKGEEKELFSQAGTGASPLSPESIADRARRLLPRLSIGTAVRHGREPFYKVPLMYAGTRIAEIKVAAATGEALPLGEKPEKKGGGREREERKKARIIPKDLVLPLGYLSVLIAIVSTLYYSWKRSLYAPIKLAPGEVRSRVVAGLRRTLTIHMVAGAVAFGVAVLHVVNFLPKLHLNISWLALGMMATVVASGAFGRFVARSEAVRRHWRHFHVPYTVLFFLTVLLHFLIKSHILPGSH